MKAAYSTESAYRLVLLFCGIAGVFLTAAGCSQSAAAKQEATSSVDRAESEFQRGRGRPPTAKTLYAMADILAKQEKDSECELVLRSLIRDYPRFVPAYNSLAGLFVRSGRLNDAIGAIDNGLRIYPDDPVLLNNSGMCWLMRRNYEKALEMFTRAAGRIPEAARYRANMAVALGLMGRDEESLALFKQLLPEDQANHNLAVLCGARSQQSSRSDEDNSS